MILFRASSGYFEFLKAHNYYTDYNDLRASQLTNEQCIALFTKQLPLCECEISSHISPQLSEKIDAPAHVTIRATCLLYKRDQDDNMTHVW